MPEEEFENDEEVIDEQINQTVKFEGELLLINKESNKVKAKKFHLCIIESSLYYYNSKSDPKENYVKFNYLNGSFIKENKPEKINNVEYFSFTIKYPDFKQKAFYSTDKAYNKNWIKHLRETTNFKNFFDFYKLDKTVGEGQFGVVKIGYNIATNKKVAIKILDKENIKTKEDWDLIKTEIDILKISKHPNIVKFLDHFENSDYIFLVMEYLNYGNLQEYLVKNNYDLNETEAAIIAYQLADALKYLHGYGIIHRDFKPENIMLRNSSKDNQIEIKLMDFGLSKILGSKEKAIEGYGTMAFVAPEIIAKQPYNSSIDIWSLGISIYYMQSGEIPFLAKDKKESTADLILNKELLFPIKFKKKSTALLNLIQKCLNKNAQKRITIDKVLEHEWFKKEIFDNASLK